MCMLTFVILLALNPEPYLNALKGSWAFWGRVSALGAKVRDLTTRVQEP